MVLSRIVVTAFRFTDFPYHDTKILTEKESMVKDLSDPGWDHRNVGIILEALTAHHEISIYEVTSNVNKSESVRSSRNHLKSIATSPGPLIDQFGMTITIKPNKALKKQEQPNK